MRPQARQPDLDVRLLAQMSRVRIIIALLLSVALVVGERAAMRSFPTAAVAAAFCALLAIYSYFAANWARERTLGRIGLSAALVVLGDVFGLCLFIYGAGAAYSFFFILLLCDVIFAAVFFHGLEMLLVVGIICAAYATVSTQSDLAPNVAWQATVAVTATLVLAWLAHGLGSVLERERVANESTIRHLSEGVCLFNDRRAVLLANPHLERLTGVAVGAVVGHDLEQLCGPNAPARVAALFRGLDVAFSADGAETSDLSVDGPEPLVLRRTVVPCLGAGGRPLGWVVTWQDVTEMVEMVRMKEQGLAVVTHEMKSPLTSLRLMAEILDGVSGELGEEERHEILGQVRAEADRMARLVGGILDFSRFDRPDFRLERAPTDVRAILRRIETLFSARCDQVALEFTCACPADLPEAVVDGDRIEQVLVNLCENAVCHTPSGGKLTVEVAVARGNLALRVADTGEGIPDEVRERVFEKFVVGRRPLGGPGREGTRAGLGIGLALSKRIVDLHGGTIEVESAPGAGTAFNITIPLMAPTEGVGTAA